MISALRRIAAALGLVRAPQPRQVRTVAAPEPPPAEPMPPLYQPHDALVKAAREGINELKRRNGRDPGRDYAS